MVFRKYTNGCEFSLKSTVLYHSIPIILYAARHFTDECGSQGACMCPKGARALVREHKGEAYRSFTNGYATRPKAEGARTLVLTHKARRLARQTIRAAEGVRSPRPPGSSAQQGVSTRWRPKLRQGACTLVCKHQAAQRWAGEARRVLAHWCAAHQGSTARPKAEGVSIRLRPD